MTLEQFIEEHKMTIDKVIYDVVQNSQFDIDDEERRLWVLNNEGLYEFAEDCGVEDL